MINWSVKQTNGVEWTWKGQFLGVKNPRTLIRQILSARARGLHVKAVCRDRETMRSCCKRCTSQVPQPTLRQLEDLTASAAPPMEQFSPWGVRWIGGHKLPSIYREPQPIMSSTLLQWTQNIQNLHPVDKSQMDPQITIQRLRMFKGARLQKPSWSRISKSWSSQREAVGVPNIKPTTYLCFQFTLQLPFA